ncbi:MAG: SLC13 family permease [Pseudomonadota bacterium]
MKNIALALGPILAAIVAALLYNQGFAEPALWAAAVTVLCATWWVLEPIPIPVTSLIPIAVFPMTGVLTSAQVGQSVSHPVILLLMGGFMLSKAMEKSGTHRRLALNMVNLFGGGGRPLVFGFMAASAILSMWISNTATVLMLLPIALAVLEQSNDRRLSIALLLGIAYAGSVGGMGTPIGTPPNLIFNTVYAENFGSELTFPEWMSFAIPVVILFVPIIGLWLTRNLKHTETLVLPDPGVWRTEEIRTLSVFALTALAWTTRKLPGDNGWSAWLGLEGANDASVAFLAVITMFLIPNGNGKGEKLLDWETAVKIPWGLLLLFGGGVCIATAFTATGISEALGDFLANYVEQLPLFGLVLLICFSVTFLTEMTSNTATTVLLMPILAAAAISAGIDPKLIMVPAAMTASCAFMLPVATGPNAVVFGSDRIPIKVMAKEGFALNLMGVVIVATTTYFLL